MKQRCLALALLCLLLQVRPALAEWTADIVDSDWSPTRFVAVDKKSQSFALMVRQSPLRVAAAIPCATGQELGDKAREGDLKTPEGVYFISRRKLGGLNYELYGDLAFVLNFPNPMDVLRRKSGHGIWIHGRGHAIIPYETQGCVALNTPDIHRLDQDLAMGMPVVIADEIRLGADSHTLQEEGRAVVEATKAWAAAWQNRSPAFFELHDPEKFAITEGQPFAAFKANKERLFKSLPWIQVTLFDVRALPGPDYWVTYFVQVYRSPTLISQGIKRLYWQRGQDGRFRIVGMEYEETPVTLADKNGIKARKTTAEAETSTPLPEGASEEETQVKQLVDAQQASLEKMAQKAFHNVTLPRQATAEDEAILEVAQSAKAGTPVIPTATDAMRQAPPPAAQPAMVAQAPAAAAPAPAPTHVQTPAQATPAPTPVAAPAPAKPDPVAKAKATVEAWRQAWEAGNLDAYMACYDNVAVQGSLRGKGTIKAQKRRLWTGKAPERVELADVTVTPRGRGFAVEGFQTYRAKGAAEETGRKTLILVPSGTDYVITEETWTKAAKPVHTAAASPQTSPQTPPPLPATPAAQPTQTPPAPVSPATPAPKPAVPAEPTPQPAPAPMPAPPVAQVPAQPAQPSQPAVAAKPAKPAEPSAADTAQVTSRVEAWRQAWEAGQIEPYLAFYAPDVRDGGRRGKDALRARKTKLWTTKPPKRVTLTEVGVTPADGGFTVTFAQDYESRDGARHKGRKTLLLVPSPSGLVIAEEKWSRR